MVPDINLIYIISAPKATEPMADADEFMHWASNDMTYVKMGKLHNAVMTKKTIKSKAKIFRHKQLILQAVIFYIDLPDKEAEKRIDNKIALHRKAANQ